MHVTAIMALLVLLLKQDVHKWVKKKRPPLPLSPPMSKKEAAVLLNVKLKATPQEIQKAFEAINAKDSTYQNLLRQARDVLLKKTRK